jgi:Dolichyl-phosphate-mannose-protein mannosyltransferase
MAYLQTTLQCVRRIGCHEYVMILALILALKALTYVASVALHGLSPLSWQAVEVLPTLWQRWDAGWYLHIAEHGYVAEGPQQRSIAFYPLYPWLIRLASVVTYDYPVVALIVSNIASILGGMAFYGLARLEFERRVAQWSLMSLLLFPTAYFFHAPYTEGLFLLLSVGAFYAARRGHWPLAGGLGAGAALTRTPGLLLLPALGIEWYCQAPQERRPWPQALWLGLILAGWLVYLLLNLQVYGTPLAFMSAQEEYWKVTLAWPWESIARALVRTRLLMQLVSFKEGFMHGGAHLGAVALLLTGVLWSLLRLRYSYSVFLLLVTLQVTSLNFLLSTPRLMLSGFPLFFMLGHVVQSKLLRLLWFAVALPLLWFLQQRFVTGLWAF